MLAAAVLLLLLLAVAIAMLAARRRRHYAAIAAQQRRTLALAQPVGLGSAAAAPAAFAEVPLVTRPDVLDAATFAAVLAEVERLVAAERSYLPAHKKGGTVAYETLCARAPTVLALYLGEPLRELVSRLVGVPVQPTPLHDQSSLSVLFYDRPGDHIGWHYDHNFYRGRHFTLLIPLVNRGAGADGLSAARLVARLGDAERQIATPPNSLVLFEGARVLHRVTPIGEGERRIVLSMTWCTDPANAWWQGLARRIKDIGFYGIRALWT
ncbi:MAG: 2OG-Fe(II) oxygenase [Geminicoccaceae bacterium]